jgi:dTMP kinase
MKSLSRGLLVSLEGIDGSGKTTLAATLHDYMQTQSIPVVLTKEPGGSTLGKFLRTIVQEKTMPMSSRAEYLVFAADRAQHFDEVIIPALEAKKVVISDRMADSSLVYQGYGRGLDHDFIKTVNAWTMHTIVPDITLYLKIDAKSARARCTKRSNQLSAFEQEKTSFFDRLVQGFDEIFVNNNRAIILDGMLAADVLAEQAREKIMARIKQLTPS